MIAEQAVFLVGGRGTRLGNLTAETPKPMLRVGDRPFLDYLLEEAGRFGLKRGLLLGGYRGSDFRDRYHGKTIRGMHVTTFTEPSPAGTAGALAQAAAELDDTFFLVNGDSFFDCNWLALDQAAGSDASWLARMTLASGIDGDRYGRVDIAGNNVRSFLPAGASSLPINAGIYLIRKQLLQRIAVSPCSLETNILPLLAKEGGLQGTVASGVFIDIGIPADFARAQQLVPWLARRPAAFLDRDGVINEDSGYVHKASNFRWIEGARDAIRWLNDIGYFVFVVTNQAGIARGYYSEEAVGTLHAWMNRELRQSGAHIDGFEYCPFHPEGTVERYRRHSDLRKPGPGMINKILSEWPVDKTGAFLIGDRTTDLEAAATAGLPGHLFAGGNLFEFVRKLVPASRRIADSD